jgi:hypothetical protein
MPIGTSKATHRSSLTGMRNLGLLLVVCAAIGRANAGSIVGFQDWQFTSSDNPTQPTVVDNVSGIPQATIAVGYAGEGWINALAGFGTQVGIWDLGAQNPDDLTQDTRGIVSLDIPNPGGSNGSGSTELTVKIVQFIDKEFYTGGLTFSLPGATLASMVVIEELKGGPLDGNWVEETSAWRLAPSPSFLHLTIRGSATGNLLDRISVETTTAVTEVFQPIITSVINVQNTVKITWSGGKPPYQLYRTANLPCPSEAWQPVGEPVNGNEAEISIDSSAGFVRVGGSI